MLTIKAALIYTDDRRLDYIKSSIRPTYRVSLQLTPSIGRPKISVALSEVSKTGEIKPLVIAKTQL